MKFQSKILLTLLFILFYNVFIGQEEQVNMKQGHALFKEKKFVESQEQFAKAKKHYTDQGDIDNVAEALRQEAKAITHQYKMEEALEKYKEVTALGEKYNNDNIIASGLNAESSIYTFMGNQEAASRCGRRVLRLNKDVVSHEFISDSYTILADMFTHNMKLDSAVYLYNKAIYIDSINNNIKSIVFNMTSMGGSYIKMGQKERGLDYFFRALDLLRDGVDDFKKASIYRSLSSFFLNEYNLPKAKEYANEALRISQEMSMILNEAESYRTLGSIAYDENDFQDAIVLNRQAITIYSEKRKVEALASIYLNMTNTYLRMNEVDSASQELQKAQELKSEIQNISILNSYLFTNCLFYIRANNISTAQEYFSEYAEIIKDSENVRAELGVLFLNYELLKEKGEYLPAIEKLEEHNALIRELNKKAQTYITQELEVKYQKAEDEKKISDLNAKDQMNSLKLEQRNRLLFIGGISLLFVLGILMYIVKQNSTIKKMMAELKEKNVLITKTLGEKELLLREIHHRVKNNLQVVSSLLSLQSREIEDESALEAISESRNRVKSMAIIHQNLYQEDNLTGINTKEYIEKLSRSLFSSYRIDRDRLEMQSDIQELNLDVDTTIPLGLILNELITNALKYAFPDNRVGKIHVELKEDDGTLVLKVKDDGIGLDETKTSKESFGLKMIQTFAKKLEADWEVTNDNGTEVCLRIKKYKIAS